MTYHNLDVQSSLTGGPWLESFSPITDARRSERNITPHNR